MKGYNSVCAKRNIIYGVAVTSLGASPHYLHEVQHRSFVPHGGNDVLATLEMMLPSRANDVVPCGTNEKIQVFRLGFFGRGGRI